MLCMVYKNYVFYVSGCPIPEVQFYGLIFSPRKVWARCAIIASYIILQSVLSWGNGCHIGSQSTLVAYLVSRRNTKHARCLAPRGRTRRAACEALGRKAIALYQKCIAFELETETQFVGHFFHEARIGKKHECTSAAFVYKMLNSGGSGFFESLAARRRHIGGELDLHLLCKIERRADAQLETEATRSFPAALAAQQAECTPIWAPCGVPATREMAAELADRG